MGSTTRTRGEVIQKINILNATLLMAAEGTEEVLKEEAELDAQAKEAKEKRRAAQERVKALGGERAQLAATLLALQVMGHAPNPWCRLIPRANCKGPYQTG